MTSRLAGILALTLCFTAGAASASAPQPCSGSETWTKTGEDVFPTGPFVLTRSQGVTHDDDGWIFSWQGGLERTDESYSTRALATWPYDDASDAHWNPDGTNHTGGSHIGDVDTINGLIYAPIEDGGQDAGVVTINDPEYQQSYVALYDAKTLVYTGTKYAVPPALSRDGVPWIAIDKAKSEAYTGEWDMPTNTLNVLDLQMTLKRTLTLQFPPEFGTGFHLSRIQGGEIFGNAMYVARDDDDQTIFKIDLTTGMVTKLFSLNGAQPSELEGLAIYPTSDGALLHVMLIKDNDFGDPRNFTKVTASFQHYAMTCA